MLSMSPEKYISIVLEGNSLARFQRFFARLRATSATLLFFNVTSKSGIGVKIFDLTPFSFRVSVRSKSGSWNRSVSTLNSGVVADMNESSHFFFRALQWKLRTSSLLVTPLKYAGTLDVVCTGLFSKGPFDVELIA